MKKTLLVLRQELIVTFSRPSYIFFAFGLPILAVLILAGVKFFQSRSGESSTVSTGVQVEFQLEPEGFVDNNGLVQFIPENLTGFLFPYTNEEAAQAALLAGEISAYYIIPPDYVEKGEIFYVFPEDHSFMDDDQKWVMRWALTFNLMGGDIELADRVWNPIWNLQTFNVAPQNQAGVVSGEDCSRPGSGCESIEFIRMIPSILVAIFYVAFMSSSSMLFNSIGNEKENRTVEVLMLSISPRQLLAGKTTALGLAGLAQTMVWLGSIYISFNMRGSVLNLPENFTFPADILLWSVVFFLGGFALYASLMAGAGAMVPKMKEAGIANFIAMIPLLFGYIFGLIAPLSGLADSPFLTFLSIFPLTSPVVMVMRLTDHVVPLWHLLLAVGLLFVGAYYTLQTVAAMFHAQNLLSGQPFSVKRYLRALANMRI